jgi:hypothetical protein
MYLVAVSKYETQYIECQSKSVARAIAKDVIDLGAGENNVRIYDASKEQLRLMYEYSVQ